MAKNNDQDNIFINNKTYPEPEFIFSFSLIPIEEIKDDCFVVLDTNALLVPYTVSQASINQIGNTYKKLINENRLVIPGQVAREFAKNRPNKLVDLYQQISDKRDQMKLPKQGVNYPLLESIEAYQEWIKLGEELHEVAKKYRKATSEILEYIEQWHWDDPVSSLYAELFRENTIVEFNITNQEGELKSQLNECKTYELPPGYKDSTKDNAGIGDLLIWKTILEVGEKHKKSLIFVSGEEKADWWYRSKSKALYPRYELVDEFRRASGGQSFHIIKLDELLELYGATQETIKEVGQAVRISGINNDTQVTEEFVLEAVAKFLGQNGYAFQPFTGREIGLDFSVIDQMGEEIGVEVKFLRDRQLTPVDLKGLIRFTQNLTFLKFSKIFVFCVSDIFINASQNLENRNRVLIAPPENVSIFFGYIIGDTFQPVAKDINS